LLLSLAAKLSPEMARQRISASSLAALKPASSSAPERFANVAAAA